MIPQPGQIVSEGTVNIDHLLPKFRDLLLEIMGSTDDIMPQEYMALCGEITIVCDLKINTELKDELFDEVKNVLDSFSPPNCSFESHPDDPACIGWFEHMEADNAHYHLLSNETGKVTTPMWERKDIQKLRD